MSTATPATAPALIPKQEFLGIENITHLAAGGETPSLLSNVQALTRFLIDKSIGMPGRDRMYATAWKVRQGLARLLGAAPEDVALLWNATAGLDVVACGMDWQAGDHVLVAASEFPSLLHVWQARGIEVRRVGTEACVGIDEIAAAANTGTRAIVVSHVSYLTGARNDLAALREIADRYGARLIVDASHSLGVVEVNGALCDVVVSCCYKWLLGTHGIAVFYVNRQRWPTLQPTAVGWNAVVPEPDWQKRDRYQLKPSSERFEGGNPSFMSAYYLENALSVLEAVGVDKIEQHVLALGGELHGGLTSLGLTLLTPATHQARAGNICIAHAHTDALERALRAQGILTWGGDGRLRISVHAYNDRQDVHRVLQALKPLVQ